jgi:hypothetical protein
MSSVKSAKRAAPNQGIFASMLRSPFVPVPKEKLKLFTK